MNLNWGKNEIEFKLEEKVLRAEVHLLACNDRILVSDVDGTLTKSDIGGLVSNVTGRDYLHEGYGKLVEKISANGYKIIFLTMRSLPLYEFSKAYIKEYVHVQGALITEPEEFLPAVKKEILKKTSNIKANLMRNIQEMFPENVRPFVGGLGNRENDGIAYLHAGIPLESIFIVDKESHVQQMSNPGDLSISYNSMLDNIDHFFPVYNAPKIGYK